MATDTGQELPAKAEDAEDDTEEVDREIQAEMQKTENGKNPPAQ